MRVHAFKFVLKEHLVTFLLVQYEYDQGLSKALACHTVLALTCGKCYIHRYLTESTWVI